MAVLIDKNKGAIRVELSRFFCLVAASTLIISTAVLILVKSGGSSAAASLIAGTNIYVPGVIAGILAWRRGGLRQLLSGFLLWRASAGWYLWALLVFPLINVLAMSLYRWGQGASPGFIFHVSAVLQLLPLLVVGSMAEELGWRGYALPRLQSRFTPLVASLLLGCFWALWHLPLFLVAASAQASVPFPLYLTYVPAVAILFTILFNGSRGSLLLATILHLSLQVSNIALGILPADAGSNRPYLLSALLTILVAAVAASLVHVSPVSCKPEDCASQGHE
jgi:membrane protease YdiL (CAAX protease family)